jgi:hypothetical protein
MNYEYLNFKTKGTYKSNKLQKENVFLRGFLKLSIGNRRIHDPRKATYEVHPKVLHRSHIPIKPTVTKSNHTSISGISSGKIVLPHSYSTISFTENPIRSLRIKTVTVNYKGLLLNWPFLGFK